MKTGPIVKTSFIAGYIAILIGAYMKITHLEGAGTLLAIGLVSSLIFIVGAIYEVRTSKRINQAEKTRWTIGLIFFSGIAGLIYMFFERRRIAVSL